MPDTIYTTLKSKILSKLQGVGKLQSANIFDEPRTDFSGFPAAIFIPVQGNAEYQTTAADKRIYKFEVLLYYDTERFGVSKALDALYDAVDDVMDTFTTDRMLSGISMPTNTVLLQVHPMASGWRQTNDQKLIVAVITLECDVSVPSS